MLRVYNNTARYVDQGGNKRPGSIAVYLEPWHADIFGFLDLKKNTGQEELVWLTLECDVKPILMHFKVFHRIIDTVSKNILDLELFFDYDLKPLSYQF